MKELLFTVIIILIASAMIGYLIWLDSGCEISGYLTWHGKMCIPTN